MRIFLNPKTLRNYVGRYLFWSLISEATYLSNLYINCCHRTDSKNTRLDYWICCFYDRNSIKFRTIDWKKSFEISADFSGLKKAYKWNITHKPVYFENGFFPKPLVIRISDRLLLKDSSMRPISNMIQPKLYIQLLVRLQTLQ